MNADERGYDSDLCSSVRICGFLPSPDGQTTASARALEESPGSTGRRCRLTAGGGDPRESATEKIPPAQASQGSPRARAKWCGKSAPRPRQRGRQGKPHREQDRIGAAVPKGTGAFPLRRPGWSREARREARPRRIVVTHPRVRTEPGLPAVWHCSDHGTKHESIPNRARRRNFLSSVHNLAQIQHSIREIPFDGP